MSLQWRNKDCAWFQLRPRRILPTFIKNKFNKIVILLCICTLITSLVLRTYRIDLEEMPNKCNKSTANMWKEISVPGQIRTVQIKAKKFVEYRNEYKTILLFTKYFSEEYSDDFYFFQSGEKTFKKYNCEFSNCFVTSNKSLLSTADAVLFHATDLRVTNIPQRLNTNQIWILYSMEPPKYMVLKWSLIESLFNWTMTYRSDSQVQVKYGEILPRIKMCNELLSRHRSVFERPKGAIWMVSNCRTEGKREQYVKELKKFFHVDVYGKCSRSNHCEPKQSEACYKLLNNYKYYLSFENSFCKDYITEKFFNALKYDIIPVVLGGGDYSTVAPANSFIDASQFPNPERLAEHLTDIARNSSWYDSFFEWKKHYSVHLHSWMCELCRKLHLPHIKFQSLPKNLWSWWVPGAFCRKWNKRRSFQNIF